MRIQGICGSSQDFVPRGHFIRRPGNGARRWESQRANERTKVSSDRRAFCERTKKEALDEARVCASTRTPEWAHSPAMPFTVRCEVGVRVAIYLLSHCASVNKSTLRAARFRFMAIQRLIYLLLLSVLLHSTRGQPTQEHTAARSRGFRFFKIRTYRYRCRKIERRAHKLKLTST
jgi:hypothetical protein